MAYPRQDSMAFDYMHSPTHRPVDSFAAPKGPDPLSGNWNYDSAIDLFSLNTNMMPDPFALDVPNDFAKIDPKEFPVDFFAPPPEFSGFTISNHSGEDVASSGSITSDLESDDQSWSPTYNSTTDMSAGSVLPEKSTSRRNTDTHILQKPQERYKRWSSSPEIVPQEYDPQAVLPPAAESSVPASDGNRKMTRSISDASNASTGQTAACGRNAAKRAAHNIIEKRYRTNMNAKFVALEKAISGGVQKPTKGGSASLKKSEILTNAIAHMQDLQEQNKALRKEIDMLRQNLMPGGGMWRPPRA
ncbi:hypothetical protein BDV59DRAFT_102809 [Aspergillus ambiguus]|uniref:uncharacterized protein n=1 Tax=Aspergillus ambiguus TaxID=176160 RepID=UPI003CCDB089